MRPSATHTYENFPEMFHSFIWQTIQMCQLFLDTRYMAREYGTYFSSNIVLHFILESTISAVQ